MPSLAGATPVSQCVAGQTTISSDTSTQYNGNDAVAVSPVNSNWTASFPGAIWIWGENPVANPDTGSTEVFTKAFGVAGIPADSTLQIAADNTYTVTVNGHDIPACDTSADDTFKNPVTCTIPAADLNAGVNANTITFTVTNAGVPDSTPTDNPAGLLYSITYNNTCPLTTGGLAVKKVVVNDGGGTGVASDFSFGVNGVGTTTFNGNGENDFYSMAAGPFTVSEVASSSYTTTYDGCTGSISAGATSTCTITNTYIPQQITVTASKVVCTDPADLPAWGAGNGSFGPITSTTASDWVANHKSCSFASGWSFQYGDQWQPDAGDTFIGAAPGYSELGTTDNTGTVTATIPLSALDGGPRFNLREELQSGYIPFTFDAASSTPNGNPVSAQFYCSDDVRNYDNYDFINNPVAGGHYYCVAFNSPVLNQCNEDAETVVVSDPSTQVDKNGPGNSADVSPLNGAWNTDIPGANWIWSTSDGSDTNTLATTTEDFTRTVNVNGAVSSATLELSADNGYIVKVNGNTVVDESTFEWNYTSVHTYDISSYLYQGNNTIEFIVTNFALAGSTWATNPGGLYYSLDIHANECEPGNPPPSTTPQYTVTIDKFIDDQAASTSEEASGAAFPMVSSWVAGNLGGAGNGSYSLSPTGFNSSEGYEAVTSEMDQGSSYTTNEDTTGDTVGASCDDGKPFALQGYTWGTSFAAAEAGTVSLDVPNFTNLQQNEYVIVWNQTCENEQPSTATVHIYKFIDDEQGNSDSANGTTFTMQSSWNDTNSGIGNGSYDLGPDDSYQAVTSAMGLGSSYSTNEVTSDEGSVLPQGSECSEGKFRLEGYRVGDSLSDAESAALSTDAPSFSDLESDQYVIVENTDCNNPEANEPATLTIVKNAIGGSEEGDTFSFNVASTTSANEETAVVTTDGSGNGSSDPVLLDPGTYNVTENLPAGWNFDSVECVYDNDSVGEENPAIVGEETITVDNGDSVTCTYTNTKQENGEDASHISVAKTVDAQDQNPNPGADVTYTITVTDTGADATGVLIQDVLPSDLTFVSTSSADTVGVYDSGTGDWNIGDMAGGGSVTLHITAQVNDDVPADTDITNTAGVIGGDTSQDSSGHTSSVTVTTGSGTQVNQTIVVRQADLTTSPLTNLNSWYFYDDTNDSLDNSLGSFVDGPDTAPIGDGSAEISVTEPTDGIYLGTLGNIGTPLSDITELQYSTYRSAGDPALALALQFDINTDGITAPAHYEGRLVYEPYFTNTVDTNTWQTWNTMTGADWWFSHASTVSGNGLVVTTCTQSTPCTWAQVLSQFPNIGITGVTDFKAGSGWSSDFTGNVDDFVIATSDGTNATSTTYDFEPTDETPNNNPPNNPTPNIVIGNGPIVTNFVAPQGQVLGASTSTIGSCTQYLTAFIHFGAQNDPDQVTRLQEFLNQFEGDSLTVNGIYDQETLDALEAFQAKYAAEILTPWGETSPTGFVYLTTRREINIIYCDYTLQFPLTPAQIAEIAAYKSEFGNGGNGTNGNTGSKSQGGTGSTTPNTTNDDTQNGSTTNPNTPTFPGLGEVGGAGAAGGSFWGNVVNFFSNIFHH